MSKRSETVLFLSLASMFATSCGTKGPATRTAYGDQKPVIRLSANLAYGDGPLQKLDLYEPATGKNLPLIIFIHGGAWISGDKKEFSKVGERFAGDGYAFAAINYRLSTDPSVQSPDHALDAAQAYAWLVHNTAGNRYSNKNIAVMGHSAGAHTAAMLATSEFLTRAGVPKESFPKAFVGLEGIYNIAELDKRWPGYDQWFLLKAFGERSRWKEASPSTRPIRIHAPWLIVHSSADELVDGGQSDGFASHLGSEGIKVTRFAANGSHDEVVQNLATEDDKTIGAVEKFLH